MSIRRCLTLVPGLLMSVMIACGGSGGPDDVKPDFGNDIGQDTGVAEDVIGDPGTSTDDGVTADDSGIAETSPEDDGVVTGDEGIQETGDIPPDDIQVACATAQDCVDAGFPESENLCLEIACIGDMCGYAKKDTDDGFDCTKDGCEPDIGVFHLWIDSQVCPECENDAECTSNDPCNQNVCKPCPVPGAPFLDKFECPASGKVCFHKRCPDCDDKDPCTDDSCDSAGQLAHTPVDCDDLNPCTADFCTPNGGQPECGHSDLPDCNVCSTNEDCQQAGINPSPACLDGFCMVSPDSGNVACGGRAECPVGECIEGKCVVKVCQFALHECNDLDGCTIDTCDPKYAVDGQEFGCHHEPAPWCKGCDTTEDCLEDSNVCTTVECVDNKCDYPFLVCDDHDPSTFDTCDPVDGCVHVPFPPTECPNGDVDCKADGNACTIDEFCDGVDLKCKWNYLICDDHDPCTIDACVPDKGCVATEIPECRSECSPDDPATFDDGNECTTDSCEEHTEFDPAKYMTHHIDIDCDDGNPLTEDWCESETGCLHTAVLNTCPNGADDECESSSPCKVPKCTGAPDFLCYEVDKDCDDGDPCTLDQCNELTGLCENPPDPNADPLGCIDCCAFP
ncbi:MAG: hypothetical protein GXP54_12595, partial [Deltaproteobacteria bacterium]|nr:hypothetical protein [Deltaproteobacteria bacterium]